MLTKTSLIVLIAVALSFTSAQSAAFAAPDSAVDEYVEDVPGGGGQGDGAGDQAPGSGPGGTSPADALPPGAIESLEALGPDGVAAANLAQATAPAGAGKPAGDDMTTGVEGSQPSDAGGGSAPAASTGNSGLGDIVRAATGGGDGSGMGLILPLLLCAGLLWALGFAWLRRRGPA